MADWFPVGTPTTASNRVIGDKGEEQHICIARNSYVKDVVHANYTAIGAAIASAISIAKSSFLTWKGKIAEVAIPNKWVIAFSRPACFVHHDCAIPICDG